MSVYYNEWDSYAAEWLRNLIKEGNIPAGDVDERSITDVEPSELKGYTQHHFFAGIGGWALATRLAGISESERIVTGSPPCQPFSTAGQRKGYADERHLAPHWLRLVASVRPTWVFGEQVAAAIRKDDWLDDLLDALEAEGYATGAIVLPACSVGAPHIRQRVWFTAWLADSNVLRRQGQRRSSTTQSQRVTECEQTVGHHSTQSRWNDSDWLWCRDGKWRPVEPGTFPLVDGVPSRVGRLRAYGNAIVPQVAAEIIKGAIGDF